MQKFNKEAFDIEKLKTLTHGWIKSKKRERERKLERIENWALVPFSQQPFFIFLFHALNVYLKITTTMTMTGKRNTFTRKKNKRQKNIHIKSKKSMNCGAASFFSRSHTNVLWIRLFCVVLVLKNYQIVWEC